ncbi:MAG: dephospho-CoA kinase [Candidatus Aminicenantales bacterium]
MLIVALTGGIATGKSVVAEVLKEKGCYIHSADQVAHRLMAPGKPAWRKIIAHFGKEILNSDQTINRAKLGDRLFSNPAERNFLNSVVHPLVLKKKKEIIQKLSRTGRYKIFISEAALTIESGFARFFDKIIVVQCSRQIQILRLMKRDHITRKEALKKIHAQMPAREKRKYADYVIDSSKMPDQTIAQTRELFKSLLRDYELKAKSGPPPSPA